jgi:hypothetical protein
LLKLFITTFVFFKINIFQRHHAQKRVFPKLQSREKKAEDEVVREKKLTEEPVYTLTPVA